MPVRATVQASRSFPELRRTAVVLVEPKVGGNVGAAARAMANMGLHDLRLVAPAYRDEREALLFAHGAEDVYRGRTVHRDLASAVADRRWVVGATRRPRPDRTGPYDPPAWAAEVLARRGRETAIVLGREDDGLTNEELDLCGAQVAIPSSPDAPSLNLAQAALLLTWELRRAALAADRARRSPAGASPAAPAPHPAIRPGPRPADSATMEALYDHLARTLLAVGYAREDTVHERMRFFRDFLSRAAPSKREAGRLAAFLHRVDKALRRRPR